MVNELPLVAARHVYTVAELTRKVKTTIEDEVGRVWVEGEVSNLRAQGSAGHCYFTLKDGAAQLSAVLFAGARRGVKITLADGMMIKAHGDVTVYEPQGKYQLVVRTVEAGGGVGQLLAALEALKQRLAAEGLFAAERKRGLPLLPQHVGLVTSPSGAALRDMLNVLTRRFPNLRITVAGARVQGDGAAAEIAAAIALLNDLPEPDRPDVLIVGRGGGSIEDLWAFNEEVVARAVAASAVPIISAVGHETDTTLCDYAADLRAPTPSAAAELVVGCKEAFEDLLQRQDRALRQGLARRLEIVRHRLAAAATSRALREPLRLIERHAQALDNFELRLARGLTAAGSATRQRLERARGRIMVAQARAVPPLRESVARLGRDLGRAAAQLVERERGRVALLERGLRALGPQAVLERGYSLTRTVDGEVVRDAAHLSAGTTVRTQLAKGSFESVVK